MHWFWRAAIAVGVGSFYGALSVTVLESVHNWVADFFGYNLLGHGFVGVALGVNLGWFIPLFCLVLLVYGLLTRMYRPANSDGETRCRKCGYILRGITEPRCPECGERI